MPLLHIEPESDDDSILTWEAWGQQQGHQTERLGSGPRYPNSAMALQATLDGQGVAFCGLSLVIDDLTSGRLIAPLGPESAVLASYAYQMVSSPFRRPTPIQETFVGWIEEEAGKTGDLMAKFLPSIT